MSVQEAVRWHIGFLIGLPSNTATYNTRVVVTTPQFSHFQWIVQESLFMPDLLILGGKDTQGTKTEIMAVGIFVLFCSDFYLDYPDKYNMA